METITCNLCGITTAEYYPSRKTECKSCSNKRYNKYRLKNRVKHNKYLNTKFREYGYVSDKSEYAPMVKYVNDRLRVRASNIRNTIRKWLKRKDSGLKQRYLGCTRSYFKGYIESQFKDGMCWNNYGRGKGKWCFDHIIPLVSAKNEQELLTLFHYSNVRPIWFVENSHKGYK